MKHFYVYYSYEEYGKGYIGKRECECLPEEDIHYFGSFHDKSFYPTQKIILETFNGVEEALEAEIILHDFYEVDKNPHFANRAKQTSTKFYFCLDGENNPMYGKIGEEHPAYGYKHTKEALQMFSDRQRGEKNHMYGRYGEKNHMYGIKHTEEARRIMSERQIGEKNHMYGKKSWNSGKSVMMWITNGIESKYVFKEVEMPEGWRKGRISSRKTKMLWITNGVENKLIPKTDEIPQGWSNGMTHSKKTNK